MEGNKSKGIKPLKPFPVRRLPHVCNVAIVGTAKASLAAEISRDIDLLRRQHESLVRVLRELEVRVVEVDLQGSYHTYLLLDHIAVSCNGIVFMPKPRTVADQKNAKILKDILVNECSQLVVEQSSYEACVCGADVLFTGAEVIVGLSETMNEAGAAELAEAFKDFPVIAFKLPDGADHIKNYVTLGGDMTLVQGPCDIAKEIMAKIKHNTSHYYEVILVAETQAANCLYLNHTLIHPAIEDIPESFKILIEQSRYPRRSVCFSEFAKLHAGLTSVCIITKNVI